MDRKFDVIIIGAGIHGASTAFHLAQRGVKSIVLEKATMASQATGRSGGLVRMHYDLEPESRLAWESFQYFRDWDQKVGGDCGFVRTGFLQFVAPEFTDQLKANLKMHQRIGIPSLLVTAADVKRLVPYLSVDDIDVAAYEPESGYADPSAATVSFIDAARKQGTQLRQGCEVLGIMLDAGRVKGVTTTEGEYYAPIVVNAAGAWAGEVARMAGVDIPITTWRHDTLLVNQPVGIGPVQPCVIDDANQMYFRPETGGLTLVGLEDGNTLGDPLDAYIERAQPGFVQRAADRICRRIPAMERASAYRDYGGFDGITLDQKAILGQMGPDGFYLQCGFSGTGFKIAPIVGACMSELILDGKAVTVDITPFAPQRFQEDQLLKGENPYDNLWK